VDRVWEVLTAIIVSCAGGLASMLNQKDKRVLKLFRIFAQLFVAGFTGVMVLFALRALSIGGDYIGLLCGLAGWSGPAMLDGLSKFGTKVGLDMPKTNKEEEKNE